MEEDNGELYQNFLKELECPVCYEYMKPPITFCNSGHNICFSCKPNMQRCPTCRQQFLQVRNLSLENLARQVLHPCINARSGCTAMLPILQILNHQSECFHGDYKCPFSKISNYYCAWCCPLADIKRHVLRDHKRTSVEIYGGGKFFSHLSIPPPDGNLSKAILVFGELFYAVWKIIDSIFYCTVLYVGPRNDSSNFSFRFTLTAGNKVETMSTCLLTRSYLDEAEHIFKPGNCIAIHYDAIEKFLAAESKLPFEMEISKVSAGGNAPARRLNFENPLVDDDDNEDEAFPLEETI